MLTDTLTMNRLLSGFQFKVHCMIADAFYVNIKSKEANIRRTIILFPDRWKRKKLGVFTFTWMTGVLYGAMLNMEAL